MVKRPQNWSGADSGTRILSPHLGQENGRPTPSGGALRRFTHRVGGPVQIGDHVTRILLAGDLFGLSDDPAAPAPGLARLVEEPGEHACGLPGALLFFLGLAHFLGDFSPQAFVPCKAKNVVHLVLFAKPSVPHGRTRSPLAG